MITVEVKIYFNGGGVKTRIISLKDEENTVYNLLIRLKSNVLMKSEVPFGDEFKNLMVIVNMVEIHFLAGLNTVLKHGDCVVLVEAVAGG